VFFVLYWWDVKPCSAPLFVLYYCVVLLVIVGSGSLDKCIKSDVNSGVNSGVDSGVKAGVIFFYQLTQCAMLFSTRECSMVMFLSRLSESVCL